MFAYMQGDYSAALLQLEEAADIARELPAPKLLGQTARTRLVMQERQDHALAVAYLEEALAAAHTRRQVRDWPTLVHLGSAICEQRDYARRSVPMQKVWPL